MQLDQYLEQLRFDFINDNHAEADLIEQWKLIGLRLPQLARYARHVHAHTASGVASERAFSMAGLARTKSRCSISATAMEAQLMIAGNRTVARHLLMSDMLAKGMRECAELISEGDEDLIGKDGTAEEQSRQQALLWASLSAADEANSVLRLSAQAAGNYEKLTDEELCHFDDREDAGDVSEAPAQNLQQMADMDALDLRFSA